MRSAAFHAIGTSVLLKVTDAGALDVAESILRSEIRAMDRTCSRFRMDSDLMRVNRSGGRWTEVDPRLIEALELALRAARLTEGAVDPTLGRALMLAGYDRDWELLEHPDPWEPQAQERPGAGRPLRVRALAQSGWRSVRLDPERRLVRVPAGIQLDLGATAKALLADRASGAVHELTGTGVLLSIGGDISLSGPPPEAGWRVHVTDDHSADELAPGQSITIASGGLATSSVAVRRWKQDGATMHHIIDPTTGMPALGPWRTVSVAAASCADANIASTATLAMGEGAQDWLQSTGLPARLVDHGGAICTLGGWPAEGEEVERVAQKALAR